MWHGGCHSLISLRARHCCYKLHHPAGAAPEAQNVPQQQPAKPSAKPGRARLGRRRGKWEDAAEFPPVVYPLPMTREEAVQAAVEGITRAWADGARANPPVSLNS